MTILLYHTDSYLRDFDAAVTEVDTENNSVVLDKTAFYAASGGQPSDTGILYAGNMPFNVTKVKKNGDHVYHYVSEPITQIATGTQVRGQIDWTRRYQLMRTHTAMHILCGVIFRDFSASVTGGDMDPLKGRMDFEFESMHHELVQTIEEAINLEVKMAREVRISILPREEAFKIPDLIRTKINLLPEGIEQVRIVEIVGLDLQADGGTHVANTSEVGALHISDYKSKGKINKRIYLDIE